MESLTKQAHPQDVAEEFPEVGYASPIQEPDQTAVRPHSRNRGHARGALVVFLGGFLGVWLYGYVTRAYEIPLLSDAASSPEVQLVGHLATSNPLLFGAFSGSFILGALGALYLRHRKKN
ncbi:MAG TPA: hypothetical protein VFE96_07600 [Candidatus Bathyarchaeia archaeon]|nr:hypothetical protein [Candidatus Bathyarchaeia archaeon]